MSAWEGERREREKSGRAEKEKEKIEKMVKVNNCGEVPVTPSRIELLSVATNVNERSDKTVGTKGQSMRPIHSISRMTQMARVRGLSEKRTYLR